MKQSVSLLPIGYLLPCIAQGAYAVDTSALQVRIDTGLLCVDDTFTDDVGVDYDIDIMRDPACTGFPGLQEIPCIGTKPTGTCGNGAGLTCRSVISGARFPECIANRTSRCRSCSPWWWRGCPSRASG